jgi:2-dehydro-3-deoxygluconokinase
MNGAGRHSSPEGEVAENPDSAHYRFDVVTLGEPMYEFSQIPGKAREYLQGFGGDTMNCAIAAARQGARVAYVSRVGDDEFGRQLFELWKREGIDASSVRTDADAHTAVYFVSHGVHGHRFSYLRKNSAASRLCRDELPSDILGSTRFFYSSGITLAISPSACDAAFAAIDIARSAGAKFVFDANVRPALWPVERARDIISRTMPLSEYFLLSLEDAELLIGSVDPEAILDWCADAGARVVILKLGAQGAFFSNRGVRRRIDGFVVSAVDATGAGDCFAGAFMARLSRGDDVHEAVRYANGAAALTCTGYGAVEPLPYPEKVYELNGISGTRSPMTG